MASPKKKPEAPSPGPVPADAPTSESPRSEASEPQNGVGKKPVFRVGPILCDRDHSVEAAVWANEVQLNDGRSFTTHNVSIHGSYRGNDGNWQALKSFRGSQLHVLIYCLQRCNDWILRQRDPANNPS